MAVKLEYKNYISSWGRNNSRIRDGKKNTEVKRQTRGYRIYRYVSTHARGSSRSCPCTSVSLTEDTVSVDANASQLGSQPKVLSGIEFHQTSFNQQVFKVRITFPLLQPAGQG